MLETGRRLNTDGITFEVKSVQPTGIALKTVKTKVALETLLNRSIEVASDYTDDCLADVSSNPLVVAAKTAFAFHLPLVLTPDVIWSTLCQGLAIHIDLNWDAFKDRCLQVGVAAHRAFHVSLDDFPYGSPEADWAELIDDIAGAARSGVADQLSEIFALTLTTSNRTSRIAQDIAFLSAVNKSFTLYPEAFVCGIPKVTLRGCAEDWKQLRKTAEYFRDYEMDWWTHHLLPILDQLVCAAEGGIDADFWNSLFSDSKGEWPCSDPTYVSGWIGKLFPYLSYGPINHLRNSLLEDGRAPFLTRFPSGLRQFEMRAQRGTVARVVGGLIGVHVDTHTDALEPKLGWGVQRMDLLEQTLERVAVSSFCHHSPGRVGKALPAFAFSDLGRFYNRFSSLTLKDGVVHPSEARSDFLHFRDWHHYSIPEPMPGLFQIAEFKHDGSILCVMASMRGCNGANVYIVFSSNESHSDSRFRVLTSDLSTLLEGLLRVVESDCDLCAAFPNSILLDSLDQSKIAQILSTNKLDHASSK
jgi:hypothetical protein